MNLPNRLRVIMTENNLLQKELAKALDISPSYISALISGRNRTISPTLAERIENRLGYSADWVLYGKEPKMKTRSKAKGLSDIHQRAILQVERLTESQAAAVLAYTHILLEIDKTVK